jgi:transposase
MFSLLVIPCPVGGALKCLRGRSSGSTLQVHSHIRNKECRRNIFAEQLPAVAAPSARETRRLCEILSIVGYALGGLPGERLLRRHGIKCSDDTVLRRVKKRSRRTCQAPPVRVLSVDDWAWRKQQRYGTMLMDLEQLKVIDLLPVRSAESFDQKTSFSTHPG